MIGPENSRYSLAQSLLDRPRFPAVIIWTNERNNVGSFFCRRQKFLYELNTSGKYFAFKEQLKVAQTISIVQYMQ